MCLRDSLRKKPPVFLQLNGGGRRLPLEVGMIDEQGIQITGHPGCPVRVDRTTQHQHAESLSGKTRQWEPERPDRNGPISGIGCALGTVVLGGLGEFSSRVEAEAVTAQAATCWVELQVVISGHGTEDW